VNAASGTVYVPNAVGSDVVVFPLEPPGPPTIDKVSVADVTATSATFPGRSEPAWRGQRIPLRIRGVYDGEHVFGKPL